MVNAGPATRARRQVVGLVLAVMLLVACGPAPVAGPLGFNIDYATGSIPPPFNYQYTIDVAFDEAGAQVTYLLEYLYRENISEAELTAHGYTGEDDISWSGTFEPDVAGRWREIARSSALTADGEPLPGADSMLVRVSDNEDRFRAGVPVDRGPWEEIAREVDEAARQALGIERQDP
jgi:hypothetical protein